MADTRTMHRERVIGLLLALLTFVLYLPVRNFEFNNFDDAQYITDNPRLLNGLTRANFEWAFQTGYAGNWHPLTWLSHMLDCQIYALNAGGHHLTNVVLHVINTLLLFGLLRRLTNALWRSAFVSALFAWHPMHVESVAWVAERKDVLSAAFWFLAIWAYWRYVNQFTVETPAETRAPAPTPTKGFYWLSLVFFGFGLLSKPMVVTLPLVLLALDYWPLRRIAMTRPAQPAASGRPLSGLLVEKIPYFLLALMSCFVTFLVQRESGAVASSDVPIGMRCENAVNSCLNYVTKLLWPRNLAVLYPYSFHLPVGRVAIAALALVAITVIAVAFARSRPHLIVGWFWFLIMLVPVIGLVQVGEQAMADRYTYLPGIGLFIMVTWEAAEFVSGRAGGKWILSAAAACCLAGCFAASMAQLGYWRNSITLFTRALDVTMDNALAHTDLGAALADQGKLDEALPHFKEALRIRPYYHEAQINVEKVLILQGNLDDAVAFDKTILESHPDDGGAHLRLGLVFVQQGKLDDALGQFNAALRINPRDDKALSNLGLTLARENKVDEALACYNRALAVASDNAYAHYGMAEILDKQDKLDEAALHYRDALLARPNMAEAHNGLGAILAAQGKFDGATKHFVAALKFKPDFAEAHYNFGNALLSQGQTEEAAAHYTEAIRLQPQYFEAQLNLANALAQDMQWAAALDHYSEALRLRPEFTGAHGNMGVALEKLGRTGEAVAQFRLALKANPKAIIPLKKLTWILATNPDARVRDAAEAQRLAAQAIQLAPADASVLDCQAAAYAEAANFTEAVSVAKKAVELAATQQPELAAQIQKRLALYEAGQPFHETARE